MLTMKDRLYVPCSSLLRPRLVVPDRQPQRTALSVAAWCSVKCANGDLEVAKVSGRNVGIRCKCEEKVVYMKVAESPVRSSDRKKKETGGEEKGG